MRTTKAKREKHTRINITLHPAVLKKLDMTAKEMNTTRSGVVAYMVQMLMAFDENKEVSNLFDLMIKQALKK